MSFIAQCFTSLVKEDHFITLVSPLPRLCALLPLPPPCQRSARREGTGKRYRDGGSGRASTPPSLFSPRGLLKSSFLIYGGRFTAPCPSTPPPHPLLSGAGEYRGVYEHHYGRCSQPGSGPVSAFSEPRARCKAGGTGLLPSSVHSPGGRGRLAAPGEAAAARWGALPEGMGDTGGSAPLGMMPTSRHRRRPEPDAARRAPGGAALGASEAGFAPLRLPGGGWGGEG